MCRCTVGIHSIIWRTLSRGAMFCLQANGSHNPSELHGEVPHNCNIFDFFILRIFFEKTGADQVTEVYEERIQFERTQGP